jgi:hypothetical protein
MPGFPRSWLIPPASFSVIFHWRRASPPNRAIPAARSCHLRHRTVSILSHLSSSGGGLFDTRPTTPNRVWGVCVFGRSAPSPVKGFLTDLRDPSRPLQLRALPLRSPVPSVVVAFLPAFATFLALCGQKLFPCAPPVPSVVVAFLPGLCDLSRHFGLRPSTAAKSPPRPCPTSLLPTGP